jgi:UDP-N-acetylglucosamine--N-acetylmuramyl-(pentapeptide) pyrophosphoryl-undecaprenol N-acetylglucosamine transferase
MAFSDRMVDLLVAADAVVARSGASFLAELAAARVPALLIPFPAAVDDHQWHNARLYAEAGAARLLGQSEAVPDRLRRELELLLWDERVRWGMVEALGRWHRPGAAAAVVEELVVVAGRNRGTVREPRAGGKAGRG